MYQYHDTTQLGSKMHYSLMLLPSSWPSGTQICGLKEMILQQRGTRAQCKKRKIMVAHNKEAPLYTITFAKIVLKSDFDIESRGTFQYTKAIQFTRPSPFFLLLKSVFKATIFLFFRQVTFFSFSRKSYFHLNRQKKSQRSMAQG